MSLRLAPSERIIILLSMINRSINVDNNIEHDMITQRKTCGIQKNSDRYEQKHYDQWKRKKNLIKMKQKVK